ncbi:cell wall-binding repeat-containing protein [Desulfosporosinus fructosivorans]|uniref:Cell wall-binding repeat-containing protein n=1 Tax=Desulfosporosinus fructosivorans TaxID=2018669 RepID=A0A4Z0R8W6_9FIRM|nr:cell wall-binding repeat-containing protein [Desulfosporosinus fructosivorans]TGE39572.1 cell wall-binding repeat-containing protein [Desulfosporosinus fructosivorans]
MKKTKKALASLAIAGMALSLVPFNAFAAGTVSTRLAGTTAEQTAVKIADQTGWTGTAILASSASYGMVDALTSGPLAKFLKAPILLQGPGATLNADTKAELTKLAVKKVYVTSGTAVISAGVVTELKGMGIEVVSLGGNDRFDTSVNIAKEMVKLGASVSKVAVAYGWLNQDALSIASIASAAGQPILLTEKDSVPASVKAFLTANITSTDVIGGTGVISDAVKAQFPGATRHFGMTAYDTNNQVIQDFAAALSFDNVFVANGVTAIDALAGAALAADTKSPIVLTDGKTVPAVATFTFSKSSASTVVTALGGEFVVPESVRVGISKGEVTPDSNVLSIVSISALDDTNKFLEITFSKPVTGLQSSDITVKNADTMARYGIKEVVMSSNGLTATVELYAQEDSEEVLEYLQDYIVTVNANGTMLTATFNRPYSLKVRVQDINVGDKEIVAYVDKGDNASAKVTLDVPDSLKFDYQAAMGELVQVWYNGDNELVNYKILTSTAKYDSIEVTADDEIKLLGEDEKYDISTEVYTGTKEKFAFYVDGVKEDVEDFVGDKFNVAKIGFDTSGDIEFVSAYSLKDVLVVDSIDEDEVVGIDGSGGFDAEDATIVKDGKVIDVADLDKGDLLLYSIDADDEDGYAQVMNNKIASGEIEEVYDGSIEVGGETYDYIHDTDVFEYENGGAVYINEDGEVADVDSDAAEELQAAGDVALYGDYAGNVLYITGDLGDVVSNTKVAVLTEDILGYASARDKVEIEALTEEGDELSFDMDLEDFDTITVDGEEYDIDNGTGADSDWSAVLEDTDADTKDDRIVLKDNSSTPKANVNISFTDEADAGSLVKLHLDDDGNLEELEFFSTDAALVGTGTIAAANSVEAGDKYINGKKLTSSTIMFDATEDGKTTDADDYVISAFGDYEGSEIDNGTYIFNDDAEVVAIWYDSTTSDDMTYDEAVVTKVLRNTDDEIVSVTVFAGGAEKTLKVDEVTANDIVKGQVVILEFEEDNAELVKGFARSGHDIDANYTSRVVPGSVLADGVDVGNKTVKVGSTTYKLADNGLVLDATDTSDITEESLSDLRGETNVTVVLDAKTGLYAKLFVIGASASTPAATTGLVTTINSASIIVDSKTTYFLNAKTILTDNAGNVLAVGDSNVVAGLTAGGGDQVVVTVVDGVATTVKIVKTKAELAAAAALATAKNAAATKVQANYTVASWTALTTALALPEVTTVNKTDKATAINNAIAGLVESGAANLVTAKATVATAKTNQADYTVASFTLFSAALITAEALPESTNAEIVTKTSALNAASAKLVLKVVTSVTLTGTASITIPTSPAAATTEAYTAVVKDQEGNVMGSENVTWSLLTPVAGVTINTSTGVVSVEDDLTTVAGTFTVVATSDTKTTVKAQKVVTLVD